jgi:hypothetical protein
MPGQNLRQENKGKLYKQEQKNIVINRKKAFLQKNVIPTNYEY